MSSSRLTTCDDCEGVVSTRAAACPHCGAPVGEARPLLTERTSKQFKRWEVMGAGVSVASVGVGALLGVWFDEAALFILVAGVGLLTGLSMYLYGGFAGWWHHG